MPKRKTTEEFIADARGTHGKDTYDYSKVKYQNSATKVTITCPKHGEFEQTPNNHLQGRGCPKCCYETVGDRSRSNTEEFIKKAELVHGDKYDYSLVKYINSRTKVTITCHIHGEFEQSPNSHLGPKQGCPTCGAIKCAISKTKSQEDFIKEAKLIHGDKYDYSLVKYTGSFKKITIVCKKHGEFEQTPSSHLLGNGCPKCHYETIGDRLRSNTKEFIKKAELVHNSRYDYSSVQYINNKNKIIIICKKHGEFEQRPTDHLLGRGCPKCGAIQTALSQTKPQEDFIKKVELVHSDKYDYSLVKYINNKIKVIITCPKHGKFEQIPSDHLRGAGCPTCSESKGEKLIREYLEKNNIKYIQEYCPKNGYRGRFDFFVNGTDIEYNGKQHYVPVSFTNKEPTQKHLDEVIKRDKAKAKYCKANNIPQLIIPYWETDRIQEYLDNFFASKKTTPSPQPKEEEWQ